MNDQNVFIFDMFNSHIYPHDTYAMRRISKAVKVSPGTTEEMYLASLRGELFLQELLAVPYHRVTTRSNIRL